MQCDEVTNGLIFSSFAEVDVTIEALDRYPGYVDSRVAATSFLQGMQLAQRTMQEKMNIPDSTQLFIMVEEKHRRIILDSLRYALSHARDAAQYLFVETMLDEYD